MYIEPGTNIRILHNVPLDDTYDHTIYFNTASAQQAYFISKQKYNLTNYSYQRVQRGVARVGIKADDLYDCNYMMFQNTNYGNKWFYAFIISVEFVNNETSQISFEIDVMQTWHFDYEPEHCFVEREHSLTDNIGDNLVPESLALGEYVFNNYDAVYHGLHQFAVIVAIVDVTQPVAGRQYDGVYGGATLYAYDADDTTGINGLLAGYLQKPEAIVGMYMVPSSLLRSISESTDPAQHAIPAWTEAERVPINLGTAIAKTDTLDGYTPKNAKLYTYPYNFMSVSNGCGASLTLRYEFFPNKLPKVELTGCITQPVKVSLRPIGYKWIGTGNPIVGTNTLNSETLELSNYALCSWNMDSYSAWIAQNSIPMLLGGINRGVNIAGSFMSGNVGGAVGGIVGAVTDTMSKFYQASIMADISGGSFSNGSGDIGSGKKNFYFGRCSISAEFARMIDDYFSMFGYAMNRVKVPNRNSRPYWNYVKTLGCCVTGSVPADDMRKICGIYDRGITFWKNGDTVGRYDLPNNPS